MKPFKDAQNREYNIEMSIGAAMNIRDTLEVDLLNVAQKSDNGESFIENLLADKYLITRIVILMCEKQFKKNGVTEENAAEVFTGAVLKAATEAFMEELTDFFHQCGQHTAATVISKGREMMIKGDSLAEKKMNSIPMERMLSVTETAMDREIETALKEFETQMTVGNASGDSPEPSKSTPDPTPSDN